MDEEEKIEKFLKSVFERKEENNPALMRNRGCRFTDSVVDYLASEWEIDLVLYPHDIQDKAIDMIDLLKGKENVPNTAARISMEVLPI